MLTQEDEHYLVKKGFSIEPSQSPIVTNSFEVVMDNAFAYLESERFFKTEFIRFPDEIRTLRHETGAYEYFGKGLEEYFVISQQDNSIYLISKASEYPLISRMNLNLATFTATFHYFLMAMHHIIAEYKFIKFVGDETTFNEKTCQLFEQVANNFITQVTAIDPFALPTDEKPSFWRTAYYMMIEADLAFYLPSVSLFDYMGSGRWGKIQ